MTVVVTGQDWQLIASHPSKLRNGFQRICIAPRRPSTRIIVVVTGHGPGSSTDTTALSAAGHDGGLLSPVRSVTSSRGAGRDVRFCLQTSEDDGDDGASRDDLQRLTSISSYGSTRSRAPSSEAGATLSADIAARHSIKTRSRPSVRSRTGSGGHHSSVRRGSSMTGSTFDGGGLYTVEYLYGLPPLFLAAVQRNVAAVRLLLDHGAVPDFVDAVGRTPLHLSASSEFFSWPCAAAMVESGARIRFRSATDRLTAAELCPELVGRQTAVLRDSLTGIDAFCRRHREMVAKRAEQQARAAAAAKRAAALHADHFRFDAGRFFRWSHRHEATEARRRRPDNGQQTSTGRRTAAGDSVVVVDPESESAAWVDCHEDRSDSITSFQSGGRVSFSVRPSVSSRPSQFDDEISQYAADGEKVYDCLSVIVLLKQGASSREVVELNPLLNFRPSCVLQNPAFVFENSKKNSVGGGTPLFPTLYPLVASVYSTPCFSRPARTQHSALK